MVSRSVNSFCVFDTSSSFSGGLHAFNKVSGVFNVLRSVSGVFGALYQLCLQCFIYCKYLKENTSGKQTRGGDFAEPKKT